MKIKYPRTPHLPWSPGKTRDDRVIETLQHLTATFVVFTEKLDGSNVCMTRDTLHSRGGDATHPSFSWLKAWHAMNKHRIPEGSRLYAEYCFAVHSIKYEDLPHYIHLFAVLDEGKDVWENWETVENIAESLGIPTVPFLGAGHVDSEEHLEAICEKLIKEVPPAFGEEKEGVVIRSFFTIKDSEFSLKIAKWVRKDHVQTDEHWSRKPIEKQPCTKFCEV